ncbi:MAG: choice-of-anchor D domain-containing protein [Candidatus Acidiferrales bacterium]
MRTAALAFCWLVVAALALPSVFSSHKSSKPCKSYFATEAPTAIQPVRPRAQTPRFAEALSLPTTFEPNEGQAGARVQFVGRGKGMIVLLGRDGIAILLGETRHRANRKRERGAKSGRENRMNGGSNRVVRLKIALARPRTGLRGEPSEHGKFSWEGEGRLRGESNYFIGNDARRWRTHVPHFDSVKASNLFPGVGAVVYGNDQGLEYDLRVAPGMDVRRLRLKISGADRMQIDARGDLVIEVGGRELRMRRPNMYESLSLDLIRIKRARQPVREAQGEAARLRIQKIKARTKDHLIKGFASGHGFSRAESRPIPGVSTPEGHPISGGYVIERDGTIAFRVGAHDPRATLVLDPSLTLAYSTFLGGAGDDEANSIATDAKGRIYVSGTTASAATWPEAGATAIGPGGGNTDFFVAKIDPTTRGANSLVYLTFIGGSANETGGLITLDPSDDVAITGTTTSADYPVTDGSKRTSGANDAVVTEIDPAGAKLLFSTLFGGSGAEATQNAGAIAVNSGGDIYIASDTTSTDLCHTPGAFRTANGGGQSDGFLAVFNPKQTPPVRYCTYLGIDAQVGVAGLALDSAGNAYLAGFTSDPSTSFPATNAFQTTYGGGDFDGFVMKIIPAGNGAADLSYATLLGGEGADQALAIATGTNLPATAYVTGVTQSTAFPVNGTNAPRQTSLKGTANAFLSVIVQNATTGAASLLYSTYLGGSRSDTGQSIAAPQANEVYVAGDSSSPDFPWLDNFQPLNGDQDAFIAKLDPTSSGVTSLIYATPFGGTTPAGSASATNGSDVVADGAGHVYVAGFTTAADFPQAAHTASGAQLTCTSCQSNPPAADAFVAAIDENTSLEPGVSFGVSQVNFGASNVGGTNIPPQNVGVINTGSAPLNISAIQLAGTNGADFSLQNFSGCESAPIAPGAVCSLSVGFVPSQVGTEAATISITDNAPGSPQVLQVAGIGSGPLGVLSPASLSFGNEPVGGQSKALAVTLTNSGNQTLQITNVTLAGADAVQFQFQDNSCTSATQISPGNSCEFSVAFQPSTTGQLQAEAVVEDNSGGIAGTQQQVLLTGTGVPAAPEASIEPPTLTFAPQPVGSASGAQTITLQNTGSVALDIAGIAIAGSNASSFNIVASGNSACPLANGSLVAGKTCTVGVNFTPQAAGAKNASLQFADNASGSPQRIALTGSGVVPAIQLSPTSVNFGTQSVGVASAGVSVTVTNIGSGPLTISSIGIAGANAGDFAQTNDCSSSLGPGANCIIVAKFTPTASGNRAAAISIADSAPGSPQGIPLAGAAIAPDVQLSPASINFGSQLNGTASKAATVTVTNSGTGTLAIGKISFTGADANDFSETSSCAADVSSNGACKIQVTFKPVAAGARSAALMLADNSPGSPQLASLTGTATDFSIDPPSVGGTSATVTAGQTANYQLDVNSTDGFTGTVALACSGSVPQGKCELKQSSVNVTANGQASFQVSVTTAGASNAASGGARPIARNWPRGAKLLTALIVTFFVPLLVSIRRALEDGIRGRSRATAFLTASALLVATAIISTGCGGNGDPPNVSSGTPAGTYSLTITGEADGSSRTIQLSLIVQ